MKKNINSNRGAKVSSKVQTLVGEILRDNYNEDKILSGISLVGSESHGGLSFVKLFYYSRYNPIDDVQKRLDSLTKTIRFDLANRMDQKYVPNIKFTYDDTLEKSSRIDELLAKIEK